MPTQVARKISEEDWLTHWATLKHLWLEEGRLLLGKGGVIDFMKNKHGFSATKSQYEIRFKKWNWKKYQKKADWEELAQVIKKREREEKESDVFIHGKLESNKKIRKQISRHYRPTLQQLDLSLQKRPARGISVRSPILDKTQSLTIDLPFYNFIDYPHSENLRISEIGRGLSPQSGYSSKITCIDPRLMVRDGRIRCHNSSAEAIETLEQCASTDARSICNTTLGLRTPGNSVSTALKAVVPKSMAEETLSDPNTSSHNLQTFVSPLHQQFLFSIANNFAGLSAFPMSEVIHFLKDKTSVELYRLLRSNSGYSARAIAQNIFRGAIEVGDVQIINFLLDQESKDIDLDEQFWFIEDRYYNAIERASALRHTDVIKCLLYHHASVNRTPLKSYYYGALDDAVSQNGEDSQIDPEIFRILLEAGGDLSSYSMRRLIKQGDGELVGLIMSHNAPKNAIKWNEWGVFRYAMQHVDDQKSLYAIEIMIYVGADLDYRVNESTIELRSEEEDSFNDGFLTDIIDVAAQRGSLEMVSVLLSSGASLTSNTLPCAIASGNEDLTRFLLERKADINSIGSLRITPLAAAIRLQNANIVDLVISHGAQARINDEAHFTSAIEAASEVGNYRFIDNLIQLEDLGSRSNLGVSLTVAIINGHHDIAKVLIDAGADTNSCNNHTNPLVEALKRRNKALVTLLLDADARPNFCPSNPAETPLDLAIEWGDHAVCESLLYAGAKITESTAALSIAVTKRDYALIDLLLNAGADINSPDARSKGKTALHAAATIGDIGMARYLLDQGADPQDSQALVEALRQDRKLFNFLFERYHARYPLGRRGFGTDVLVHAICNEDELLLKMMLAQKADANAFVEKDDRSMTPFGYAIEMKRDCRAKFVELLLLAGGNPNSIVFQSPRVICLPPSATGLLAAIGVHDSSTVELLIRYGADANALARGPLKRTPLQKAAETGNLEIVELLINHGVDVNASAARRGGGTALQLAAIGGYIPIICMLLNHKADVNGPASKVDGRTALEGAAEHGRLDTVQLLLNAGAGSTSRDPKKFARAIKLARENWHHPIGDLLEAHIHAEGRGEDLEMLVDGENNGEEFINWDGDQGVFSL